MDSVTTNKGGSSLFAESLMLPVLNNRLDKFGITHHKEAEKQKK
jgi:hypothetical protein